MKRQNRTKIIVAIFLLVIALSVATVIALSVLEIRAHKHEYAVRVVAPTCVDDGYTLHTCACGESFKDEFVNALGHDFAEDFTVDSQPDCTAAGSKSKHCSRCESTAEETVIPANGHSFGEWDTISERSCTAQGIHMRVCGACGESETKYETPLGHDLTCTTDEYNHQAVCNRCDFKEKAKHAFEGTVCADCKYEVHPTQGLWYELNEDGASYKVTGIGEATDVTDLVIFSTHNGLPVTDIYSVCRDNTVVESVTIYDGIVSISGDSAFWSCDNLHKVTLPATLTHIPSHAFSWSNLREIKIDEDNPVYQSVDNCVIEKQTKTLCIGSANSRIPSDGSVTSIGDYAFSGRVDLTEMTIPDCISLIGEWAFNGCTGLTKIEIPATVKTIKQAVFKDCENLNRLIINEGVSEIGDSAFNSTALNELHIPKSVKAIGRRAFIGSKNLKTISVDSQNEIYRSINNCFVEISSKTLLLGCAASIIPTDNSVTAIGEYAFYMCEGLTGIEIPTNITNIGDGAFYSCVKLESVEIPDSVASLGVASFYHCNRLKSIKLSNSIKEIKNGTFGYSGLVEIDIPYGVTKIGTLAFRNCADLLTVHIPESVTDIGGAAFRDCVSLKNVNLPTGKLELSGNTFSNTGLETFTVSGNITEIGNNMFSACRNLKNIVIEEGVKEIWSSAFFNCENLTEITIPKSIIYIYTNAFRGSLNLKTVNYAGTVGEWNKLAEYCELPKDSRIICSDGTV